MCLSFKSTLRYDLAYVTFVFNFTAGSTNNPPHDLPEHPHIISTQPLIISDHLLQDLDSADIRPASWSPEAGGGDAELGGAGGQAEE